MAGAGAAVDPTPSEFRRKWGTDRHHLPTRHPEPGSSRVGGQTRRPGRRVGPTRPGPAKTSWSERLPAQVEAPEGQTAPPAPIPRLASSGPMRRVWRMAQAPATAPLAVAPGAEVEVDRPPRHSTSSSSRSQYCSQPGSMASSSASFGKRWSWANRSRTVMCLRIPIRQDRRPAATTSLGLGPRSQASPAAHRVTQQDHPARDAAHPACRL
jgi:hypothetical protein